MDIYRYPLRTKTRVVDSKILGPGERIPTLAKAIWTKLYYIPYGQGYFSTSKEKYEIKNQHLYIFPRNEEVHFHIEKKTKIYWAHIYAYIFSYVDLFDYMRAKVIYPIEDGAQYEEVFKQWAVESKRKERNQMLKLIALSYMALAPIESFGPSDEQISQEKAFKEFVPILEYIQQNFSEKITVASLAKMLHLSDTHFASKFAKVVGIAPLKYVNMVRIEAAQNLLVETNDTLQNISWKVGYSDVSHFSKTFKEHTQFSPGKFRKINPLV